MARFTELQTRLGDAYRTHLNKPDLAALRYRVALHVDPAHEAAQRGQSALIEDPDVRRVAVRSLADAYEQTSEWQQTLDLLEPRLWMPPLQACYDRGDARRREAAPTDQYLSAI